MKYALSIILITLLPFSGFSQTRNKTLVRADHYYKSFQYKLAIPHYLKLVEKNSADTYLLSRLADSYRKIKNYRESLKWYSKLVAAEPQNPQAILYYAEALANNNNYKSAGIWYAKYHQLNPDDERGKAFAALYNNLNNFYADSVRWEVGYASVNSARADFSPVFFKRGLMFTSNRDPGTTTKRIFGWDGTPFTDIYLVPDTSLINVIKEKDFRDSLTLIESPEYKLNPDDTPISSNDSKTLGNISGTWVRGEGKLDNSKAVKVTGLNSKYHDGPVSFAENQSWGMLSRNGSKKKKKGSVSRIKLYSARYAGGEWYDIKPFQYNSNEYSCGHPALSEDGSVLYFISDMPGGFGGTDLYYCLRTDTGWTKPVNLGKAVNTAGNEMFPYLDDNGELYFSSTGLPGLGGLDIFKVRIENNLPKGIPENLGYPVNTSSDDFGFIRSKYHASGYFSSNRKGNDDIYKFNLLKPKISLEGFIFANTSAGNIGLKDAEVFIKGNSITDTLRSDASGGFYTNLAPEKEYEVRVFKQGYLPKSKTINTDGDLGRKITLNMELSQPVVTEEKVIANIETPVEDVNFRNIYYDFDKSYIRKSDRPVLDSLANYLKKNVPAQIIATSHTDTRGSYKYNLQLSRRRSNAVKAYLTAKGVDAKRIIVKYKGESMPVNQCKNGGNCSERVQKVNRRTEFTIIE